MNRWGLRYLQTILTSDVPPSLDVIQWHGIYNVTPDNAFYGNYYYEYPAIMAGIRQAAAANGAVRASTGGPRWN